MEEQWLVDRSHLRDLLNKYPDWTRQRLAEETGRSLAWVKKWVRRFREADPADDQVLQSRSRARKTPPPSIAPAVVVRILEIRDEPPENLRRTPGPKTILYYLHKDAELQKSGPYLPRSTRTVWEILDRHQRIIRPRPSEHEPVERPAPWEEWGVDFKDVSSVPADPDGKQRHVGEIMTIVDHGTSALVETEPRRDYTAETALQTLAKVFQKHGCPSRITLDRDPRWVGSWSGKDFPSALLRFLLCVGIEPHLCPPKRPDKNPFVERYHKNLKYECLLLERPENLEATREANAQYAQHYNFERPNQAITCDNQPPRVAFPAPPQLPGLPDEVDPDGWLLKLHGKRFKRRVNASGSVQIGKQRYYIQRKLHGRYVVLVVDAHQRVFLVELQDKPIKQVAIKGLHERKIPFWDYLAMICQEALAEWRHWRRQTPR